MATDTGIGAADAPADQRRLGDVFQMTFDGELLHPLTGDPDDRVVAVAAADPVKMDPLGSTGQTYGYGVEIDVFDSLEQVKNSLS